MANQYSNANMPDAEYAYKLAQLQNLMYGSGNTGTDPFNYFDRFREKQAEQAPFVTNVPAMANPFGEFTNTLGQLANNAIQESQRKEVEQKYNNTSKLVSDYRITMSNALASGANQGVLEQVSNAFIQELGNNPDKYMAGVAYQAMDPSSYFKRLNAAQQGALQAQAAASGTLGKNNAAQDNKYNAEAESKQLEALSKMDLITLLGQNLAAGNDNALLDETSNVFLKDLLDNLTDDAGNINVNALLNGGSAYDAALKASLDKTKHYMSSLLGSQNSKYRLNNNVYSFANSKINATENNELEKLLRERLQAKLDPFRTTLNRNGDLKGAEDALLNMNRLLTLDANEKFARDNGLLYSNMAENPEVVNYMGNKIAKFSNHALDKGLSDGTPNDYMNLWYNTKVDLATAAYDNAENFKEVLKDLDRKEANENGSNGQNISIEAIIGKILPGDPSSSNGSPKQVLLANLFKNMGISNGHQLKKYLEFAAKAGNNDPYLAIGMLLDRSFTMDWSRGDNNAKFAETLSVDSNDSDIVDFYKRTASSLGEDMGTGTSDLLSNWQQGFFGFGDPEKSDLGVKGITKEFYWDADTAKKSLNSWVNVKNNRKNSSFIKRDFALADKDAKYNEAVRAHFKSLGKDANSEITRYFGVMHSQAKEDKKKREAAKSSKK